MCVCVCVCVCVEGVVETNVFLFQKRFLYGLFLSPLSLCVCMRGKRCNFGPQGRTRVRPNVVEAMNPRIQFMADITLALAR